MATVAIDVSPVDCPVATQRTVARPVLEATSDISRPASLRVASALQTAASILWIPQAALLSMAVGNIAAGAPASSAIVNAAGVLALGVLRSGVDAYGARLAFRAARSLLSDRRCEAIAALSSRSPNDGDRPAAGLAASTLTEQAEAIVPYLSRYRPARLRATLVPIAILACVAIYSWAVALVLLFAAPLIPLFMALIGWRAKAASEAQLVQLGGMNAFLLDRLRGMATIRTMRAIDVTAARLRADAESLRTRTMAVLRIAFLSSAVLELFAALGVAMVAVYVGFHLLDQLPFGAWGNKLSLAEGLFILLLAPAFFEPLRDLSAVWHDRAAGEAALDALGRIAATTTTPLTVEKDGLSPPAPSPDAPAIGIENLRFRHDASSEPVFDHLNLDVAPGEHVALLAPSGGGKSTLLALLAGFVEPECGRIMIGGRQLTMAGAGEMHRRMAWIGQHPHVFAGTLIANVTLGRDELDRAAAIDALRIAGLGAVWENRGTALIGEHGVGLSGGEASRLVLARIAVKPEADLILADEPTAHLDSGTAAAITDTLLTLATGRTLVVATHDPVLAAQMDRVVDLRRVPLEYPA